YNWIKNNPQEPKEELLSLIRLPLISGDDLWDTVLPSNLFTAQDIKNSREVVAVQRGPRSPRSPPSPETDSTVVRCVPDMNVATVAKLQAVEGCLSVRNCPKV